VTAGLGDVAANRTLWTLATAWADRRGAEPVLVSLPRPDSPDGLESLTWLELVELTFELRQRLAAAGVRDGARVVVCLPNSPLVVAVWLAVQANGGVVHVVDPDAGRLALERAVGSTRPVLAVAGPTTGSLVQDVVRAAGSVCPVAVAEEIGVGGLRSVLGLPAAQADPPDGASDDVSALLPTSGTSGAPKLVALTQHNIVMASERLARNSGFLSEDRHYLCSPFFHTNAQFYLCSPAFVTGGSMAVVPRFSAGSWFDAARWTGSTVSSMVAPPLRMALHRAIERSPCRPRWSAARAVRDEPECHRLEGVGPVGPPDLDAPDLRPDRVGQRGPGRVPLGRRRPGHDRAPVPRGRGGAARRRGR
jgi:crotonobetaine/carnitine-CoA ligase